MSLVSKNSKISLKKTPRRSLRRTSISRRRRLYARRPCKPKRSWRTTTTTTTKVSAKLETLKNLIPAHNGEIIKAEHLFQETADYIVLLKTQVFVLQRLVEFYGSTTTEAETNAVS
ncbi:uncharacterized protein LOC110610041 [Manihot esculenta]|uniref:BHLH domain-containing protein n=1 Tax=Manihot esculenta TaxID=3983 RepID=A0A2C9WB72_MANES|nr:uncharacterized protein LOC110610041 [Manihot esculenta]OAY56902.1 hypothetical protein MANES_02G054200v8 [Manihot esculenta]